MTNESEGFVIRHAKALHFGVAGHIWLGNLFMPFSPIA
jgi:hypothetical protein